MGDERSSLMKIYLIAVGTKMPDWVSEGFNEYCKRFPRDCSLILKEIPAGKRGKNADIARITEKEGEETLAAVPHGARIVTLDIPGKRWTTPELSKTLERWMASGQDIALLVGGPEGLSEECKAAASESWSLSPLTFPHPRVRILVAESLYRAGSLSAGLPYHRE